MPERSFLLAALMLCACTGQGAYDAQDGDIVFQTSRSAQSRAIQLATDSRYSHMGIVYLRSGVPYVFEAVQPVKMTPLNEWIDRGENGHFVAKRLRNAGAILTPDVLARMREVGEAFMGRDYDLYFEWSDDRIYCSELVWKVYARGAGIGIGSLLKLADFDLSHPSVQAKVRERFGDAVPLAETVVSPADIFEAQALETVYEDGAAP